MMMKYSQQSKERARTPCRRLSEGGSIVAANHFNGYHEIVQYTENPHILVYLNDEPTDYPTHWHTPLELLMPIENTYTAYIGNKMFQVEPYNILFVAPNAYHSYVAPDKGRRYFIMADIAALSKVSGINQILSLITPTVLFTANNSPKIHARMKKLFLEICDAYFHPESLQVSFAAAEGHLSFAPEPIDLLEAFVYSKLMEILILVAQNYTTSDRAVLLSRNRQHEYVNKMTMVCNYIDLHCTEGLSLEQMSRMINFSKYHFSRMFKEFTHESFYRYVNRKRIQYAENLLLHQKLSVTETALASGYSNTSSFIRMFKSINGITPGEFREKNAGSPGAQGD